MTVVGLVCFALLDMLMILAGIIGLVGTGAVGGNGYDPEIVSVSVLIRGLSGLGQLPMFVYTPICFGMLLYRFAKNARSLGFTGFEYSPGWCVGWFFIPFAHLWMPYKANSEVWQSSKATDAEEIRLNEWRSHGTGPLFLAWWLTWIFGTLGNNISSRMSRSVSEELEIAGYWLMPFAAVAQVVSAILAILVITKLASRQRQQHRTINAHQGHWPMPVHPQENGVSTDSI